MTPVRFLVVDDNPTMRRLLEVIIKQLGFSQIDFAGNGREALLLTDANVYNIIILDHIMPRMTGIEFLWAYRQKYVERQGIVIIVTGIPDETLMAAVRTPGLGISDVIIKPFDIPAMKERILRAIERMRRDIDSAEQFSVDHTGHEDGRPADVSGHTGPLTYDIVISKGIGISMLMGCFCYKNRFIVTEMMETPAIASAPVVALDLTKVRLIDEYGLGALLVINGILRSQNRDLIIVIGDDGTVLSRLEATWVVRLIPTVRQWHELYRRVERAAQS